MKKFNEKCSNMAQGVQTLFECYAVWEPGKQSKSDKQFYGRKTLTLAYKMLNAFFLKKKEINSRRQTSPSKKNKSVKI